MTGRLFTRRRINMILHWALVFAILAMMKGSARDAAFHWAVVLIGGGWVLVAMINGVKARPGPKLTGGFRKHYRLMHRVLYALVAVTSLLHAGVLMGVAAPQTAWIALLILFGAGMFHALFQMWRHTALYDGALRTMTPKIWHKHL